MDSRFTIRTERILARCKTIEEVNTVWAKNSSKVIFDDCEWMILRQRCNDRINEIKLTAPKCALINTGSK